MKSIYHTFAITMLFLFFLEESFSQPFWQFTDGPYDGATVNDYLYYNTDTIFIATNEGIIRSADNGNTWGRIDGTEYLINCLAKDDEGILYAGAVDNNSNSYFLKSTNRGLSWSPMNTGFYADIRDILIPYRDTILVGTWLKGIYRSFNRGQSWYQVNNGLDYTNINMVIGLSNGYLLIGTNGGGIYKSTDWGDSWIVSNNGIPANYDGYKYAYSLDEISPSNILAGTHYGIFISTDNGSNWSQSGSGLQNKRANSIIHKPNGYIYAGIQLGGGVYCSSDNGMNWYFLGLDNTTINSLGLDPDANLFAGSSNKGLYKFNESDLSWNQIYNQGYTPIPIDYLNLGSNSMLLSKARFDGLYLKTEKMNEWESLNFNGSHSVIINDSTIITAINYNVLVSTDTGKTWQITGDFDVRTIYYDSANNLTYIGTARGYPDNTFGIYYSTDFGFNWNLFHIFENSGQASWVNAIHITSNHQYILASTVYGDPFGMSYKLFRSTDKGESWNNLWMYADEFWEDSSGNIFALNEYYQLLLSTDEGESWSTKDLQLTNCLAADKRGVIYIGGYNGVSYSTDFGNNWMSIDNSGLQSTQVNDIVISRTNYIYIATDRGVYTGNLDDIILSAEDNYNNEFGFMLYQNYPNPFNPSTKIQYAIGSRQYTTLKVYDVLGNEVATLVSGVKPAGTYEVEFNTEGLPSGVYFYRLQAGNYVQSRKMILMK